MSSSGEFKIHIRFLDGSTRTITLGDQPLLIGSGPEADLRLEVQYVSRRHFQIELVSGRVYVTDLGSQNGTNINGQPIEPLRRQAFALGDKLTIANTVLVQLEFAPLPVEPPPPPPPAPEPPAYVPPPVSPPVPAATLRDLPEPDAEATPPLVSPPVEPEPAPAAQPVGRFVLAVEPEQFRARQPITLTLTYVDGQGDQHVYFRGHSPGEGLEFDIEPHDTFVRPGAPVVVQATVRPTQPFWFGGRFLVNFMAQTAEGLFARAEAQVRVRPRYELLLLLILLLTLPVGLFVASTVTEETLPTPTATDTPTPSLSPTITPTPSPTSTPTATSTATPTLTPFPSATSCFNQCAALGWPSYVVQPGDTLFSLAQAASVPMSQVISANCIANANVIQAGQSICLPVVPTIPTNTAPPPTCDGFRLTSPGALPNGMADFFWDAPRGFTPTGYRVEVFNAENNTLLVSREVSGTVTTTRIDVSQSAIGGNFTFFWRVTALRNGTAACTDQWNVLREAPPTNPPPVTDPPAPQLSVRYQCFVEESCWSNGALCDSTNSVEFTVTNSGGAMTAADTVSITDGNNVAQEFEPDSGLLLGAGQSKAFTFVYDTGFYDGGEDPIRFTSANTGLSLATSACTNQPPTVTITTADCAPPDDRCRWRDGNSVSMTFTGTASDPEDSKPDIRAFIDPDANLVWSGEGSTRTISASLAFDEANECLSGESSIETTTYTFTMTVMDTYFASDQDSVTVTIWRFCPVLN